MYSLFTAKTKRQRNKSKIKKNDKLKLVVRLALWYCCLLSLTLLKWVLSWSHFRRFAIHLICFTGFRPFSSIFFFFNIRWNVPFFPYTTWKALPKWIYRMRYTGKNKKKTCRHRPYSAPSMDAHWHSQTTTKKLRMTAKHNEIRKQTNEQHERNECATKNLCIEIIWMEFGWCKTDRKYLDTDYMVPILYAWRSRKFNWRYWFEVFRFQEEHCKWILYSQNHYQIYGISVCKNSVFLFCIIFCCCCYLLCCLLDLTIRSNKWELLFYCFSSAFSFIVRFFRAVVRYCYMYNIASVPLPVY